jgi:hypothetical protein
MPTAAAVAISPAVLQGWWERSSSQASATLKQGFPQSAGPPRRSVISRRTRRRRHCASGAEQWLGADYREIAPEVFRARNGTRQVRMTERNLDHPRQPPQVHLEAVDARKRVTENSHVYLYTP